LVFRVQEAARLVVEQIGDPEDGERTPRRRFVNPRALPGKAPERSKRGK
jgi:hypothetical protein